jgi:PAS domain-containing protein
MSVYDPGVDRSFNEVFNRADGHMYEDKKELKTGKMMASVVKHDGADRVIPDDRKRQLDSMFGAIYTTAGEGYVFLTDLKYDFSRWSLSLINDFGLQSEYMYHVEKIWENYIHPDDVSRYLEVVDAVIQGNSVLYSISYRARKADGTYVILKPRGFVLCDSDGVPEYFGGIIIPQ